MKLLAVETSTEACSVALWLDGRVLERFEVAPRRHTELVLPWAGELLAEAGITRSQLDAIAVGRGPGAFTGVRLAVALVQGIALALDRPVLPVSTLAALALPAAKRAIGEGGGRSEDGQSSEGGDRVGADPDARLEGVDGNGMQVLAAIDARMGELYLGRFAAHAQRGAIACGDEWMATAAAPSLPEGVRLVGVGSGFAAGDGALARALGERLVFVDARALPHAADVAHLAVLAHARGEAISADQLEPAYLRNNVAATLLEQAQARRLREAGV